MAEQVHVCSSENGHHFVQFGEPPLMPQNWRLLETRQLPLNMARRDLNRFVTIRSRQLAGCDDGGPVRVPHAAMLRAITEAYA
jgi:hypothetical protein